MWLVACVFAITPVETCPLYRCAVSQLKCTAALIWAKCIRHCSVLLCKTGSEQACVLAITPAETCPLYRCAVSQIVCTAALLRAKYIPHCSVLLCKLASKHACVDLAQQITRAHRSPVVGHRSGHTCANRRQLDHAWIHYTTGIEDFIFLNANKHLQGKYEGFRCGRNIKGLNALQISAQSVLNSGLVLI